jgi:hypothetical protein
MPKKSKAKISETETEEPWVPTRQPYLENNPFASLTLEEARARLKDLYPQLHDLEFEIDQLRRIVVSHNITYMDRDGIVHRAV